MEPVHDTVVATSTPPPPTGGERPLVYTVHSHLESNDAYEQEAGVMFLRKVWALLVLQYSVILIAAAPFSLLGGVQHAIEPYHWPLEVVALSGIVASLVLAVTKGPLWPFAHIALCSITIFVGFELGLTFANPTWGVEGLIAVGQATTSFAIILALLQFDLAWLTYIMASFLCFILSTLWLVLLYIAGVTWPVAAGIAAGGWAFTLLVLGCCHHVTKQVAPGEHILAVLFILVPEALLCLAARQRHPQERRRSSPSQQATEALQSNDGPYRMVP
jgi:hypothetical protein